MYKNLTKEEVEELNEKWEKEYENGLYGHNDFEIADFWLSQIDQLIGKRMEEERAKHEELLEWAEGVVNGTAFSKENGLIWQHWLDMGKRILQTLTNKE